MPAARPIFAGEKTAASLLDMKPSDFRRLVQRGALPGPVKIGDFERWSVTDLEAIVSGRKMDEEEPEW